MQSNNYLWNILRNNKYVVEDSIVFNMLRALFNGRCVTDTRLKGANNNQFSFRNKQLYSRPIRQSHYRDPPFSLAIERK